MDIEVITSITGGKDTLMSDQKKGQAVFTAFVDDVKKRSKLWILKPAYNRFTDPRRNSRIHKILIHKYSEADVTIWIDGKMKLLMSPEKLIKKYLQDYDMAIFSHMTRNCIYDEAMVCAKLKLDEPETIIEQAKYYEDHEFAKQKGLCEGGFIIRRNNEKTRAFNEAWWADYCRFSRRDQLSLMPAVEQSGVNVNFINETWDVGDRFAMRIGGGVGMVEHLNNEGNWNQ